MWWMGVEVLDSVMPGVGLVHRSYVIRTVERKVSGG